MVSKSHQNLFSERLKTEEDFRRWTDLISMWGLDENSKADKSVKKSRWDWLEALTGKNSKQENAYEHETFHHFCDRCGYATPNSSLGFRFRIRIILRALMLSQKDFVLEKYERLSSVLKDVKPDTLDFKPDYKHYHTLYSILFFYRGESSGKRMTTLSSALDLVSGKSDEAFDDSACHISRIMVNRKNHAILKITREINSNCLTSMTVSELTEQLFSTSRYFGLNGYDEYCRTVEHLFFAKLNISLLRSTYPELFGCSPPPSYNSEVAKLQEQKNTAENKGAIKEDELEIKFGFMLDEDRKKRITEILSYLKDDESIHSPLLLVKAPNMDKAQASCIAYLLGNQNFPESPMNRFSSVVYIPCNSTGSDHQITYQNMLAALHAHFYPEQHTDSLQPLKDTNLLVGESPMDLTNARLKETEPVLRSALKDIRIKLLQEPTLIVFGGLIGVSSYDEKTFHTRALIDNNPAVNLIRKLTEPGVSDRTYLEEPGKKSIKGSLKHFFDSRILVFTTSKTTGLEDFAHAEVELDEPDIEIEQLIANEANINKLKNVEQLKQIATPPGYSIYVDQSHLYQADLVLTLQKSQNVPETISISKLTDSIEDSDRLSVELLESVFTTNPLHAIMLAILSITSGGVRQITLIRLLDRFIQTCIEHKCAQKYEQISNQQFLKGTRNFEQLSKFLGSLNVNSNPNSALLNNVELQGLNSTKLLAGFTKRFLRITRLIAEDSNNQIEESLHSSAYNNDILSDLSDWQSNLYGEVTHLYEIIQQRKVYDFADIKLKKSLSEQLCQVFGSDTVSFFHYMLCDESLRQHQLQLRSGYWIEESYRHYRLLFQSIMHGFLFFKYNKDESVIHHFRTKLPKNKVKLFLYIYVFLFRDLAEDNKNFRLFRTLEVTHTRAELNELALRALLSLEEERHTTQTNKDDELKKLTNKIDSSSWESVEHELYVSSARGMRRDGWIKQSSDFIEEISNLKEQDFEETRKKLNRERSKREIKSQQRNTEIPVNNIILGYENRCNVLTTHLSEYDQIKVDALTLADRTQKTDMLSTVKKGLSRRYSDEFIDEVLIKTPKAIVETIQKNTVAALTGKYGSLYIEKLIAKKLLEIKYQLTDSEQQFDKFPVENLSQFYNLLSSLAEWYYFNAINLNDSIKNRKVILPILHSYIYFSMADVIRRMTFTRQPFGRSHYINSHKTRAHIRMLFHYQKVTKNQKSRLQSTYPGWLAIDENNKQIIEQIRYLIDSLSLTIGRFQRERSALLILESQYCRIVHSDLRQSFKFMCQAARYLTVGSLNRLVSARLYSERIKLLCEIYNTRKKSTNLSPQKNIEISEMGNDEIKNLVKYDLFRLQRFLKSEKAQLKTTYWEKAIERRIDLIENTFEP